MKSKILHFLYIFSMLFIVTIFVSSIYFKSFYSLSNFEEIIYSIKDGTRNADTSFFSIGVKTCLPFIISIFTVFFFLLFKKSHNSFLVNIQKRKKSILLTLFILSIIILLWSTSFFKYVYYQYKDSDFIESNYINPRNTVVEFAQKRNLILISVESLETSLFSKNHGGYWEEDIIPELYELLSDDDSVVFYNNFLSEQSNMIQGSSWTTASIIANSSGLPFKVNSSIFKNDGIVNDFYTLGELLQDNGYYNEVISAASMSFGDLKNYYSSHGDYTIIDIDSLDNFGFKMNDDDKGKWGFNDHYLFEIAKNRLNEISLNNQPFNLQLITIDTHFIDGYVGNYSENNYSSQYENAYATESKLIYDFVTWVKTQPYYDNTTIVIMGDHLSMQSPFFRRKRAKYRYVYNCYINPIDKDYSGKGRIITALDTFPTIVSAIGGKIENDKLGLGVNLFSNQMTLAEKYGINILNKELKKNSPFYNKMVNSKRGN